MPESPLHIAAPQSLSNHIALNAFHPIYRSLFEYQAEDVQLHAWDNAAIFKVGGFLPELLRKETPQAVARVQQNIDGHFFQEYLKAYLPVNTAMTELLPGDIEFLHTAAFPSFTRPFVLHCEMFAPLFYPFSHQGEGKLKNAAALKQFLASILEHDLCLGVFSHIPETLRDIALFFNSPKITAKLHASRIGVSHYLLPRPLPEKTELQESPTFLFINSAHQNPGNFTKRGGHLVLRFWQEILRDFPNAKLYMRCQRPFDAELKTYQVDTAFVREQSGKSIIWIEQFLSDAELNQLFVRADFFLLPSLSLHSASIMQAMSLGAIPVVSDTIGTSTYVTHGQNGIVLKGIYENFWFKDEETGVMLDQYRRDHTLEDAMVRQLTQDVTALLQHPETYHQWRAQGIARAKTQFSGYEFRNEFWRDVRGLWDKVASTAPKQIVHTGVKHCLIQPSEWTKIFSSVPQPVLRIHTGGSFIYELGGYYSLSVSRFHDIHDWSAVQQFVDPSAPPIRFYENIENVEDILGSNPLPTNPARMAVSWMIQKLSGKLRRYPMAHAYARYCYHRLMQLRRATLSFLL